MPPRVKKSGNLLWEMSKLNASPAKCLPSKRLAANPPPRRGRRRHRSHKHHRSVTQLPGSPAGAAAGAGEGRGRVNPRPGHPLIRSVSMGARRGPNYGEKSQPFSTCQSKRGAALSGKLRGISLVLLLLLFNSQGCGIYSLSLLIIRPSQIKMIDSHACFTAALGGYYSC